MTQDAYDVLIVGTGHAGAQAAVALRQHGFEGRIAMVGAEPDWPYERPPLSKDYLAGDRVPERLLIRPPSFWEERDIDAIRGQPVVSVEPDAHEVVLAGSARVSYRSLVWAAGGKARRLSCEGNALSNVFPIRSRGDVDRLRERLPAARRVAIIGGGYIGLEAAAVLNMLGKEVVVIEALGRVLARVAGAPISEFIEKEHRARGTRILTDARVKRLIGDGETVSHVELESKEAVPADIVIVGIGIDPIVGPLLAAGAEGSDGVAVDAFCRTSLPDIFAIGDCAAHESRFAGGARVRLESVQNAHDQALVAATAILGDGAPYESLPWFWSNQFDLKLQTVGLSVGHDEVVLRGDPAARSFSAVYLKEKTVIALDCINAVKDYVQGRALILSGVRVDPRQLADPQIPLKALVTGSAVG